MLDSGRGYQAVVASAVVLAFRVAALTAALLFAVFIIIAGWFGTFAAFTYREFAERAVTHAERASQMNDIVRGLMYSQDAVFRDAFVAGELLSGPPCLIDWDLLKLAGRVVGPIGSGKTVFLRSLVRQLCYRQSPAVPRVLPQEGLRSRAGVHRLHHVRPGARRPRAQLHGRMRADRRDAVPLLRPQAGQAELHLQPVCSSRSSPAWAGRTSPSTTPRPATCSATRNTAPSTTAGRTCGWSCRRCSPTGGSTRTGTSTATSRTRRHDDDDGAHPATTEGRETRSSTTSRSSPRSPRSTSTGGREARRRRRSGARSTSSTRSSSRT